MSLDQAQTTETVKFDISGMTCAGCAGRVEKALSGAPGVVSASVNLALENASVTYYPAEVDTGTIAEASNDAGYPAHLHEDHVEAPSSNRDVWEMGIAIALTLPLVAQMVAMWTGIGFHLSPWMELALATPVQFIIGRRFYKGAWHALKARAGNMDQLVVVGTSAAFFYSLYLLLTQGMAAKGHLYFEAAAVVITLVLLGKFLESRAKASASAALRQLMALRPDEATVLRDGVEQQVPIDQVRLGDVVIVRPGERVAVDGAIIEGESELDESLLTGEPMPVARHVGDAVIAGAINGSGLLRVETRKIGSDTTLARIADLVEQAQVGKAPIQRLVDRVAGIFVPVVLVIAVVTFGVWLAIGGGVEGALTAAISVLVIACPCALGLATPTALVAGTGVAAKHGILIRNIEVLERARDIDTVVFDKTGTLTMGKPEIVEMKPLDGTEEDLLRVAASLQSGSEHPLGKAMVAAAEARGLTLSAPKGFKASIGAGVEGSVDGAKVMIGRQAYAADGADAALADDMLDKGQTVVWVSRDGEVLGLIGLADTVRDSAKQAVKALHDRGIKTLLLTGDNQATADLIAAEVGIDEVRAEMRPLDKVKGIKALVKEGRKVAMVGDGVNDAPALAEADLGIAMGSGADVALETAGFVLMRAEPTLVGASLDIAQATARKIRQNLFWAFIYNIIGIPIAAMGLLNPALAGAAMAFSSVSVVSNALLLKRWRP